MEMTRAQASLVLAQTYPALVELTGRLVVAELDYRPAPDEWSIREILAHLVDDEIYVTRLRLERIVKEDAPELAPHDEQKWYASRNTSRDELSQLLADFQLQRQTSLAIIAFLRENDWQRRGHQPEYGYFSAEEWLGIWANHDLNHLRQIENNLKAKRG